MMTIPPMIEDKELGLLYLRTNARARRFIFRTKEEAIYVTVPPQATLDEIQKAIEELRPKLKAARQSLSVRLIDLNFRLNAEFFKLSLVRGVQNQFLVHSELGEMQIICPPEADFSDPRLQGWLHKVIDEGLRRNAKVILPSRLHALSVRHKLLYKSVKVNASSGRWGSCSSQGNINLSCHLLLLPEHLMEYVLLHELAHLREMNHAPSFWDLLNRLTDGKAYDLREELRQYEVPLF